MTQAEESSAIRGYVPIGFTDRAPHTRTDAGDLVLEEPYAAGHVLELTNVTQMRWRPERLLFWDGAYEDYDLVDVKVQELGLKVMGFGGEVEREHGVERELWTLPATSVPGVESRGWHVNSEWLNAVTRVTLRVRTLRPTRRMFQGVMIGPVER